MLLIISIPITIVSIMLYLRIDKSIFAYEEKGRNSAIITRGHDGLLIIGCVATFLLSCVGVIISIIIIVTIICTKTDYTATNKRIEIEEQRKAIVSCIELDNANAVTLSSDIADFNSKVLLNRRYLSNFWLKDCTYDFYNEIELIDVEAIVAEKTPIA